MAGCGHGYKSQRAGIGGAAADAGRAAPGTPAHRFGRAPGLSASRFLHLFKAETGVPLRRYRIWNRMGAAVRACGEGSSLTEAAHAAGFASSAHFSSAFRDMFGMMPSDLLKALQPVEARARRDGL
ncbi:helix-turn-helix transcriptional regulator [Bradyrhizobium sp. JYMT SZCCT0180]|nr:helix-turn-helix transcriptional regulator [Bradyrhizobium sp. JYMT SZCCT0180]